MLILHPSSCCDVCLEVYNWGNTAQLPHAIPCGHVFCKTCLTSVTPPKCPLCRKTFVPTTAKKLHVDRPAPSKQDVGELELLRRLSLSWSTSADSRQVQVLKEVDAWLRDRPSETSIPLRIAREAVDKCQAAVRGREQDKTTIKQLKREIKDHRKRMPLDHDGDAALVAQTNKSKIFEEKLAQCNAEMDCLRIEMESLRTENDRMASFRDFIVPSYKKLQVRTDCLDDENRALFRELQDVKSLLTDTQSLLEVKDEELKTAPPAVIRKVTALNHEIMRMATLLGELVQTTETAEVKETTSWMLDKRLASFLSTKLLNRRESGWSGPDVLLAVIVFRIAITRWCQIMITSWKASDQLLADSGEFLDIRQFDDPTVCGHWRSNTRAHFRRSSFDDLNWSEGLLQGLCDVLDVAGWSIREPDPCLFEIRLSLLFAAVKNLRIALREGIKSIDLEVATIEADTVFNSAFMNADPMSSPFISSQQEGAPETVIGTTGFGLWAKKGPLHHFEMAFLPNVILEGVLSGEGSCMM